MSSSAVWWPARSPMVFIVQGRAHERFHRRLARFVGPAGGRRHSQPDLAHARALARRGLDEGSELLIWVRAVATAILAGVIAQILVQPPGALASVPAFLRYGALLAGFVAFLLTRRSIFGGVLAGEIVMLAGTWWFG